MPDPAKINLESGLVPKGGSQAATTPAPAAATTPQAAAPGGIDLSSGMVAKTPPADPSQQQSADQSGQVYDERAAWEDIKGAGKFVGDVLSGAGGEVIDTLGTASRIAGKAKRMVTGESGFTKEDLVRGETQPRGVFGERLPKDLTEQRNTGEHIGGIIENIGEFMMGDEALKGMSYAEKLKHTAPVLKIMEKFPRLAKMLDVGIRQGVVGGAQGIAHGETPKEAAGTGVIAGVTGGLVEGGANAIKGKLSRIKPSTATIAGETVPKLASQEVNAAADAKRIAPITNEPEIAAAQQKGAQKAIKNIAHDAAKNTAKKLPAIDVLQIPPSDFLKKVGADEASVLKTDADRQTVTKLRAAMRNGDDIPHVEINFDENGNITGADGRHRALAALQEGTERMPVTRSRAGGAADLIKRESVNSFADAADQVRDAAKPVFERLDQVSDNAYTQLNNTMKEARQRMAKAATRDAYAEAQSEYEGAKGQIETLFDDHAGTFGKTEMKAAKDAWRNAIVLDKVHAAVEGAFNGVPESVAERAGVQRGISGGALQRRLGNLLGNMKQSEVERVIGKEGLDNLYKIADLTSTPQRRAQYGDVLSNIARYLGPKSVATGVGAAVGHATGMGATQGAFAGAAADEGIRKLLHRAAVDPVFNNRIAYVIEHGVSPRVYASILANEVRKSEEAVTEGTGPEASLGEKVESVK